MEYYVEVRCEGAFVYSTKVEAKSAEEARKKVADLMEYQVFSKEE